VGASATDEVVIEATGLRMSYDGVEAVRGIDLRVRRGEIFTFLGPNGAGKSFAAGIDGGTVVHISGAVAGGNHDHASDPEHWSEALGGARAP
jgi:ABC-2 type transport system ATP-binding protein